MNVVYWLEPYPTTCEKSIFLAGPTARQGECPSWRDEALELFERLGWDGTIFIPEPRPGLTWPEKYQHDPVVDWEIEGLNRADCILFWVPRSPDKLPGFTTNIEWGEFFKTGRAVLGCPDEAIRMNYMKYRGSQYQVPFADSLLGTIQNAISLVGFGALRTGGETCVPLHIWQTESFQQWYTALKQAGNRLESAKVEWVFRVGPKRKTFFWVLHVDIYVAAEQRHKTNEVVLARPDISTVVLIHPQPAPEDSVVVLIREFRSPAATPDGFVREVPGGSSWKPNADPLQEAAKELAEETGLHLAAERLRRLGTRQLVATLSAHRAHAFVAEVTADELATLQANLGKPHGVASDTEQTYVEIATVAELLSSSKVDWSMLGMILQAVHQV